MTKPSSARSTHRKVDEIHRAVRALWKDLARLQSEQAPQTVGTPKTRPPAKRTRTKGR